ncbi:MAG: DUF928 domain-containing protein [Oculatellaceae cyanobacterium bins.114]|nr:DUF928 domain-containing protein [Oculatellaceae cyanobacterium bins.114]
MLRFYHSLSGFLLFAVSLVLVTPVQAEVEFRANPHTRLSHEYQQRRQEPNYAGCPCGCRRSRLLALVPEHEAVLTVSTHPDFFVAVPALSDISDRPEGEIWTEFWLSDSDTQELLYLVRLPLPEQAGILRLPLSADLPALQMGKDYEWGFSLICDDDHPIGVYGIVRRVEPPADLSTLSEQATPHQLASRYANAGIWVEAIATLAQARQDSPENAEILNDWRSLLQSVELDGVIGNPFVQEPFVQEQIVREQ